MEKIKVGIVGTGYTVGIAANHVNGYLQNPGCILTALYDIIPGRAAKWAEEKKLNVEICSSYDELLDKVDAVSICTPNYSHVDLAVRAMEKGKHLLCEKPLSLDSESSVPAVSLARCCSTVAMIGFSYRGIPAVRYMRKILKSGSMGKIFTYRETLGGCRITNPNVKLEWRMQKQLSGTGALADFGCHMLDLCDWLFDGSEGPVSEVNGFVSCSIPKREEIFDQGQGTVTNDDLTAFNVRFQGGAIASFVASRLGVARHTIEIYGEGGMMLFRDDRPNELEVWFKEKADGYKGKPEIVQADEDMIKEPWFYAEIDDFIHCIQSGERPDRNFDRALYIQRLLDKILLACETGKTINL